MAIPTAPEAPFFPILTQKQIEILNQIINQTQPNTTAFNALLGPYETTLNRHHINPKSDEAYYSLLLKLSLIPGNDWKQKWKAVSPIQTINTNLIIQPDQNISRPPKSVHFLPTREQNVKPREKKQENTLNEADFSLPVPVENEVTNSRVTTLLVDYADVRARKFRREKILDRFLKKWLNAIIRWNLLRSQVQSARQVLDLNRFFSIWKRKSFTLSNLLRHSTYSYNQQLLTVYLDRWRRFTIIQSDQKWLLSMKDAFRKIQRVKDKNLCRQVLIVWTNYAVSTHFNQSLNRKLAFKTLSQWYKKFTNLKKLSVLSRQTNLKFNSNRRRILFLEWYQITLNQINLKKIIFQHQLQFKLDFLITWKFISYQSRRSSVFYLKSRLHTFLRACKKFHLRQRTLKSLESRVIALRNLNLRPQVFRRWIICERGELLASAHASRLSKMQLQRWRQITQKVHYNFPRLQAEFTAQSSLILAQHQFKRWKDSLQEVRFNFKQAQRINHFFRVRHAFSIWRLQHEIQIERCQVEAPSVRTRFLTRRVLRIWKRRLHKKRVQLWSHRRKLGYLDCWLSKWILMYRNQRRLLILFEKFDLSSKTLRRRAAFLIWQARYTDRVGDEEGAVKRDRHRLKKKVWIAWRCDFEAIQGLIHCANSILAQRLRNHSVSLLNLWVDCARFQISLKFRFQDFFNLKRRTTMMITLEIWTDHLRWRKLSPIERNLVSKKNRNIRFEIMKKWIFQSNLVASIRDRHENIKVKYFQLWNKMMRVSRNFQTFERLQTQVIRKVYLRKWLLRLNDLKSLRIISRFKHNIMFSNKNIQNQKLDNFKSRKGNRIKYQSLILDFSTSTSATELEDEE